MAETWEDFGELAKEERYQRKSTLGKIFSGRTLLKVLKYLMYALVLLVYGLLFFRLCTGKPPAELSALLWTESVHNAHAAEGDGLIIYEQEPIESIAKDGYFSVSDIRYIPSAKTFQLTVRYNNSSIEALSDHLYEKEVTARRESIKASHPELLTLSKASNEYKALLNQIEQELEESLLADPIVIPDLGKTPFLFVLRDEYGNVYSEYSYIHDAKTVYQYMRISYENVPLFGDGTQNAPEKHYPTPDVTNPAFLYKGTNASDGGEIHYLYMDMYYIENADVYSESFAYPLQVYTEASELLRYDYKDETHSEPVTNLVTVNIPHN